MKANWKAYLALATICLIWGTTYLALRIGVESFPPFLLSGIRQTTAGLVLVGYFLLKGSRLPPWKELKFHVLAGFLMVFLGNGIVAWGEKFVPSGIAAVICSLMPVWVILITTLGGHEKPRALTIVGVLVGFAGIAGIFGEHLAAFANPDYAAGIAIIFVASFCWALGTLVHKRKNAAVNPVFSAGMQMASGGVLMLAASPALDDFSHFSPQPASLWALLYLTVFGSIVAYSAYAYALGKLPASTVSMYAYINPMVALVLGYAVLDEKLNPSIGLFCLVTLAGIYLVNKGNKIAAPQGGLLPALWTRIRRALH